jgi:hypothetical protein
MIMLTVLYSYGTFNDNLAVSAASQEMAIVIRQAQTYGLTVKEVAAGGGQFSSAYGVHFDTSDPGNYYLFADLNGNGKYDAGSGCGNSGTECIQKNILRNGITISSFCDDTKCPPSNSATRMDVTFLRPVPDATIIFTDSSLNTIESAITGKVVLKSPKNKTVNVTIQSTGQVSVQ